MLKSDFFQSSLKDLHEELVISYPATAFSIT